MVGRHPAIREVYRLTRRAAAADLPVLVVGETGTGKELVARAVHELSSYAAGPFIDVNCAAIPESLAEAQLFGWEQGAFTGAMRRGVGYVERADGGTLFLDEACSLGPALQAKLLRVLEHRAFWRVGDGCRRSVTFRLVLAVAEEPEVLIAAGRWRRDFAYWVSGILIRVPPLRERPTDIPLLAEHFLAGSRCNGHPPGGLAADALDLLVRYPWPGSVRELKTLIERLTLLVEAPAIGAAQVVAHLPGLAAHPDERRRLQVVIAAVGGNVSRAARALGMSRATLYRRLRHHGLIRRDLAPSTCLSETPSLSH
jgi:transcriptional regulator with PAS, ATPase and Fis domain